MTLTELRHSHRPGTAFRQPSVAMSANRRCLWGAKKFEDARRADLRAQ
jgi:hypothetical protein